MDISLREIFESMPFSFSRNGSYVRNIAKLPEVERIATLRGRQALLDLFTKRAHTSTGERNQMLAPIRAECMDLMVALERQYGDGHYAERKKCLDNLLEDLQQNYHVDLTALLAVLRAGYRAREVQARGEQEVDARRNLARHGRMVRSLRDLLLKLEKSYETLLTFYGSGFVIVEKLAAVEASLTLTQKLHSLRTELEHDPLAQELFPGPYRRPRIGKPTATWRKLLRSELNRVGVPDEFEESLLISTGLLPYRPLPSVVD
jgi:hypothetical protein